MKKFFYIPFDFVYPFFCGVVISALVCFSTVFPALMAKTDITFRGPASVAPAPAEEAQPEFDSPQVSLVPVVFPVPAALSLASVPQSPERGDPILDTYRDNARKEWVIAFFMGLVHSRELADAILTNASAFNISPSLAFALSWTESRFNSHAVNRKNRDDSIDRGLFQLNNRSFPQLTDADFFNPVINSYHAMAHLRWCLDTGGSTVAGLAMYNAGTGRVKAEGAPKRTLDYVSQIMEARQKIDDAFELYPIPAVQGELPVVAEVTPEELTAEQGFIERPRLSLLTPIAGRSRK
jgi:hypothetical protein